MSMSSVQYSWASSHIRWLNCEPTNALRIISFLLMMRTKMVLEALVDSLSTYLTQLLAWEYFIGCKNCYVMEFQSDICMFIHKAWNTVVYQEFVLLSPRPKYSMIHRQKNGKSRHLSYSKLNTWVRKVALPKLNVTGNSFRVFKPWEFDRQTGSHHFWIWKPQVSLFVIQRGWNN